MCNGWYKFSDGGIPAGLGVTRLFALFFILVFHHNASAADPLWVDNPDEVPFSVGKLTRDARDLGLSDSDLAETLSARLSRAGLTARPAGFDRENGVLFLDIIVEKQVYYASLGFWRMATYPFPDGELGSDLVIVWQDYSVGAHDDDPAAINDTVLQIIDRFIAQYSAANQLVVSQQAASNP